jgi:dTDP-4-dehydrorhamnose reductase
MKKIILTGASSFTGTKFIELYGSKYAITPVSREGANPIDLNDHKRLAVLFDAVRPDVIVHLAATIGREADRADVLAVDTATTKFLVDLAKEHNAPFVYNSSEIVYDGRPDGMYEETTEYHFRSDYGRAKVANEEYLKASGLPYLITRGHRYIGYPSADFDPARSKKFTVHMRDLIAGKEIHLDAKRKITPPLIDNICDVIDHYIEHDSDKQIILNVGTKEVTTYYNVWLDIARVAGMDTSLVHDDGDEPNWLTNNTLSTQKLRDLGYPQRSYGQVIDTIAKGIKSGAWQ